MDRRDKTHFFKLQWFSKKFVSLIGTIYNLFVCCDISVNLPSPSQFASLQSYNRIKRQIFFSVSKLLYRSAQQASLCQAFKQLLLGTLAPPWKGYPPYARPGRETLFGEEWRVHSA